MSDRPETTEKPTATRNQRKAAAGHSKRYRQAKKEAGVPNGREIDTAIATFLIRRIIRKGIAVRPEQLPELQHHVIWRAGWDRDSDGVKAAVAARVAKLGVGA